MSQKDQWMVALDICIYWNYDFSTFVEKKRMKGYIYNQFLQVSIQTMQKFVPKSVFHILVGCGS